MAVQAVQTYNFQNFYLVQRDSPGSWSTVSILYDAGLNRTTLSMGALNSAPSTDWGIVVERSTQQILFLGAGIPDTPQQIAAGGSNYTAPGFWDSGWGAVRFGGAWWVTLIDRKNHFDQFTVLRSVTGAAGTWGIVDSANQPTSAITSGSQWAVRIDKATGIVYVFGNSGTRNQFSLWTMDMNAAGGTGLWSASFAPVDMGRHIFTTSSNAPTEAASNGIVHFANGDIGVFYCVDLSDNGNTYYRLWNGASWGSEVVVALCDTVSRTAYANCYLDANTPDLLHVFHYVDTHAGLSPLRSGPVYDKVTHVGVVTPAVFTFPVSVRGSDGLGGGGIHNGEIFAPFDDQTPTNPPTDDEFLANSIWVAPVNTGIFVQEFLPYPIADVNQPPSCAFMAFELETGQTLELDKVVASGSADPSEFTLTATGGSPETDITGPGPTVGPESVSDGTYELSEDGPAGYVGTWDCGGAEMPTSTSVVVPVGGAVVCTLTNNLANQTLTLKKVVQGGPAAPSDFTLSATGGSPETTITGPGPQVGPDDVNAGTFELSEGAPGGSTWDAATSTWDSPAFVWDGNGQYTPVWDCAGAPMPTPTSVVVSPGGGGPIGLGVTQVPDVDPTFAPLLSNGAFEFLVGGFLYQVLWNSGNRLGMFRRQASVAGAFTEIDATNAPTGISGYGRATLRGTIIAVCYMLPGNTTVKIVEFNTVSSGWGIPTAALTLLATTATFAFEKRSDGTYVFVAGRPNVVYYATNTGGAWSGTHILLTLGSGIVVLGGVIDSADRIWLLLNTNSTTVGLYALSSTYVLGSSVATATLLFPGPPYPYIYYPQVALWGTDAVAVAYNTALTIGGAGVIRVKIGVGLSAPVVTSYDVYTVPAGTEQDYLMHPRDDGSGNLNLFFVHTNTGVVQVKQSTFDGASTWNTPSTFYDAVTTPPFAGSASQAISTIDPVPSNGWAVGAAMQTDQPTEITTAEIIQESSGGGSSDVVCTVINYFTGPAPAPPGPGQMNPVGCFELLRVDATLTPAKHLPTRGSVR